MTDRAVEVDIHQTRQGVGALGIDDLLVFQCRGAKDDAPVTDDQIFFHKAAAVAEHLGIFDNHSSQTSCLQIRLRASSSPTRMKSGCICRMLAGTSGVTGPKKAFLMISALPAPLATISTLRACMMVLMPMV